MSKGNLFLGQGRGSVGDVVFYRANGQQLARSRNRSPRNPKTDAQILQRAISATVVQAYKAGKAIFDHAFEGKEVPAGCQRRFLSLNMRKLRAAVVSELDAAAADSLASVVSPSQTYPVPNSYRISEGSLIQNLFTISKVDNAGVDGLQAVMVAAQEGETIAQFASRLNLNAGEIFTICAFGINPAGTEDDLVSPQTSFGFVRLIVKDSVATSTTAMDAATFDDFFTIDSSGSTFPGIQAVTQGLNIDQVVSDISALTGSMGVIRSNENSGLRSTSDMVTPKAIDAANTDKWGVKSPLVFNAWSDDAGGVQSSLILEGGGF